MSLRTRTPAQLWKWSYIFVNLFALVNMLFTGELMGDAQGLMLQRSAWLIAAGVGVAASYWFLLGPLFDLIARIRVAPLKFGPYVNLAEDRLGVFLIIAQILFMAFNVAYGVNIAGSATSRTDSSLGIVWVALPVDSLFLIYYAVARRGRFFTPNLAIYVVSNVMRGWTGIFLFLIFLEMCRVAREKKIKWKVIAPLAVAGLVFYPVLLNLKWILRAASGTDVSLWDGIEGLSQSLAADDYLNIIFDGVMQIVARLQITSAVEEVIRYSSQLQHGFEIGAFKPFWLEGLHGIVVDRFIYGSDRPAIGVAFTSIGDFSGDFDVGSWNTNTGWIGWLFVAPLWFPFFIVYTAGLCFLCFYFAKKLGMPPLLRDLVWFAWLVYLLPGWLGAFVGFVYSLFVFFVLKYAVSYIPRWTLFRGPVQTGQVCK